jgi:hypothetical protein
MPRQHTLSTPDNSEAFLPGGARLYKRAAHPPLKGRPHGQMVVEAIVEEMVQKRIDEKSYSKEKMGNGGRDLP